MQQVHGWRRNFDDQIGALVEDLDTLEPKQIGRVPSPARARGRLGGRKPIPLNDPRIQMAKKMHAEKSILGG